MDEKQLEERFRKLEEQVESLFKNDHANEIWQAKADMKFEQIITVLDNLRINIERVQSDIINITQKPARRIDSMITTALTVLTTAVTMWVITTFKK